MDLLTMRNSEEAAVKATFHKIMRKGGFVFCGAEREE